jgi:hypothetical protein
VKSWQRPSPRRRFVFALFSVLIAFSYTLLLADEEAQAKGGKQSSKGESAGEAIGGAAKPVQEAAGEVNKLASTEGAGGKDVGSLATRDLAPRTDKPVPVDDGTVRHAAKSTTTEQIADKTSLTVDPFPKTNTTLEERTGSLGEVTGKAREATGPAVEPALDEATSLTRPALEAETKLPRTEPILAEVTTRLPKAEPILEETVKPEIAPVLDRATSETGPVLGRATAPTRTVLEETPSTVEPLLDTANSKIEPALERVTAPVSPVLEKTVSTVEPVLGEANTLAAPIFKGATLPVEPALTETLPAIDPVLDGAIPAAAEPVGEAVGTATRPLGEAVPTAGPVLEEAAFPGVEPAVGAAAPVFDPISEMVAPVVESGFGEGVVRQSAGSPVLEGNTGGIPASLSALPSQALAMEAGDALPDPRLVPAALGSARDYGPVRDESLTSTIEPPGARSGLFDGWFAIDGSHAALLDTTMSKDTREGTPRPFPSGLPPSAPPVGISFDSSGAGMALELLAILALLPVLSRVGGLPWSNRAAFKLGSSLQLTVERPG